MKLATFNSHKPVLITSLFVIASFFAAINVSGQQKREPDRGLVANGAYALSNIETINTTNGNLMLNIPLASLPAGRGPGFTYSLRYDSKLWNNEGTRQTDIVNPETQEPEYFNLEDISQSDTGGWQTMSFYKMEITNRLNLEPLETCGVAGPDYLKAAYIYKVRLRFPDGSVHEMRPGASTDYYGDGYFKVDPNGREYAASSTHCTTSSQLTTAGMTYYSTDGSRIRLVVDYVSGNNGVLAESNPWTLYFPDGGKVVKPLAGSGYTQRIYDRNNNYVSLGTSNGYAEDQFGRVITGSVDSSDPTKHYVIQTGVDGESLTTTIKWKEIWVYRLYDAAPGVVYCNTSRHTQSTLQSLSVVDYIELPEQTGGLRYTFDYNGVGSQPSGTNYTSGWGELKQIELPSGATVDYDYWLDGGGTLPGAANLLLNSPTQKQLTYDLEYDVGSSSTTDTWLYDIGTNYSIITGPDGGVTNQNFVDPTQVQGLFKGMVYKQVGPDGSITERVWASNAPENVSYASDVNAWVKYEFTTIPDASGDPNLTATREFFQDKNGNTTFVKEYGFAPYSGTGSVPRTNGLPIGPPSGATPLRITKTEYYNDTPDSASTTYTDTESYHLSTSPRLLDLAKSTEVQDGVTTPKSRSEMVYDYTTFSSNTKGGNLTETKSWDSLKGGATRAYSNPLTPTNSITTSATYNSYGMPLTATDANANVTQITYGLVGGYYDLYPTQTIAAYGTSIARTSSAAYDFYTGLVTTATDVDNNVSVVTEYDALGRPTKVRSAAGTPLESWTRTEYDDVNRRVVVRSDLETIGDGKKVAIQHYDQLGRVRLSRSIENIATEDPYNEAHGIKVETRYGYNDPTPTVTNDPQNTLGAYTLASNPFRAATATQATNEQSMGWTVSYAAKTGRHSEVTTFSGAGLPVAFGGSNTSSTGVVTTDIDADRTLVTDQAGKQRISKTNALGQLKDIWEVTASDANTEAITFGNPAVNLNGYKTSYSYDTLNNLTTVNQGVQTRSFTYSSLSRLLSATNPESGTISYGYDNNGNLTAKTDARGVQTAYVYDALNRVTNRNYTAPGGLANYQSTPNVSYFYDNVTNAKGKLTKVTNGTGANASTTEYGTFDILGRVTRSKQTTDGVVYGTDAAPMTYTYNLSGAMIEQKYPSGRVVKNVLDADGDLAQVQSKKNVTDIFRNYANSFVYTAAGAVSSLRLGNGKFENTQYNSRLQPTQIGLGASASTQNLLKLNYDYGTTDNNGNVKSQTITVPTIGSNAGFTANQTYTYDNLNRIKDAKEMVGTTQTWMQTFLYDRYGNRNFDTTLNRTTTIPSGCAAAVCNPAVDPATNKLVGYQFDNLGNTKTDAENRTFIYDAENKQVEVKNSSNATVGQYFYDGDGKRVKKYVPSTGETTIFVYDAAGKLVAEYSTIVEPPSTAKIAYLTNDHLGSPRINTDAVGAVTARHDYHPFGEEIATSQRTSGLGYADDTVRKQFTGYERDIETDLDFAQARMYSNTHGRFNSTDPIQFSKEHPPNPQRWNLYIYVVNNPLALVDKDGRKPRVINIFLGIKEGTEPSHIKAEGMKQWRDLAKKAPKGVTVNIYTLDEGTATAKEFIKSVTTKNTTTVYFGHSYGDNTMERGKGGVGLEFHDSQIAQADQVDGKGKTLSVDNVDAKGSSIGIFACDSGKSFDNIRSSNGTALVSMQNGPDLGTSVDTQNKVALEFARTAILGSTPQVSRDSAQTVFFMNKDNPGDQDNPGVSIRTLRP